MKCIPGEYYIFYGTEIDSVKPDVTVKYFGETLEEGKDYTLTYKDNNKAGTATVIVTGKGLYTGVVMRSFTIEESDDWIEYDDDWFEYDDDWSDDFTDGGNGSKNKSKISKIKLSGISHKIAAGRKIKLTANILPKGASNKKLTWSTSNKRLAKVTQTGWVSIDKKASPGKKVKITAKAKDGSGKKQVFSITIMKGVVKKITVKGYKKNLKAGKTMKLKAVVKTTRGKPVNKKLKWTSNKPKYAKVSQNGTVTALSAGKGKKVKIKIQATDGSGKTVIKTIKIK